MATLRGLYIFVTKDKCFVKITKNIVEDILTKEELVLFNSLDKRNQLLYLKFKDFALKDIEKKTKQSFLWRKQLN